MTDRYSAARISRRSGLAGAVLTMMAMMTIGCVGEKGAAPSLRPPENTLAVVHVWPINAIMAVGDTMSLVATGQTIAGAPVTTFDSVQYMFQSPADSLRLRITSAGLVTARATSTPNSPVVVNVFGFKDGAVAADQALVQVVATSFSGATLSIQPIPPDSAKLEWEDVKRIVPVIRNSTGQSVTSPVIRYEYGPGDSTVMQCYVPQFQATATLSQAQLRVTPCGAVGYSGSVSLNGIRAFRAGTAWVHARVQVFGVALHDSVFYTLTNRYATTVQISTENLGLRDNSGYLTAIAPGGVVTFTNGLQSGTGASVGWTFDNPSAATSATPLPTYGDTTGNIPPITVSQHTTTRRFNTPGVYTWTATVSGGIPPFAGQTITGKITVQ
jgi:hypothetical protein